MSHPALVCTYHLPEVEDLREHCSVVVQHLTSLDQE